MSNLFLKFYADFISYSLPNRLWQYPFVLQSSSPPLHLAKKSYHFFWRWLFDDVFYAILNGLISLIKSEGWLLNLFRGIVAKAKDFLQNLIREKDMPPKPTLDIDMAEFRHMRNLMIKAQDRAVKIKNLQDKALPQLKQ